MPKIFTLSDVLLVAAILVGAFVISIVVSEWARTEFITFAQSL